MACRITELVLDCKDPDLLGRFWAEVLGWEETDRDETGVEISPPDRSVPHFTLLFSLSDDARPAKLPLHIDVNATDRPQAEELERLLAIGARQIDIGQGSPSWHVLADPEGNEFCLLRRTVDA